MYIRIILAMATLCCVVPVATLGRQLDVAGSADHEAITRYKGSVLLFYDEQEYDAYLLPLGNWTRAKRGFESSRTVEGEVTRRSYVAPEGPSVLAVYRNFERAVQNSGLKILYGCLEQNCDRRFARSFIGMMPYRLIPKDHYHNFHGLSQMAYIAGEGEHKGRPIWVSIGIGTVTVAGSRYRDTDNRRRRFATNRVVFFVDTVEGAEMATDMVTISLDKLAQALANEGKMVLDGIFFDTGKAVVKPKSDEALAIIADYLNPDFRFETPKLTLY